MLRRTPLVIGLVAILAVIGVAAWQGIPGIAEKGKSTDTLGGAMQLIDQDGKAVSQKNYQDKWMLVFFGFTSCPDICPTGLLNISNALQKLGPDAAKIRPIFITLDADRDQPAMLKSYLANFPSPTPWAGLTGTQAQVDAVADQYRVYHVKQSLPESELGYTINHSGFIYLMNKAGKYQAHFSHSDTPEVISAGIKKAIAAE